MREQQPILYDVACGRATITLNRPDKRNALSRDVLKQLNDMLWVADEDTRVHSVLLRGSGPDFCAGYDIANYGDAAVGTSGNGGANDDHRRNSGSFDDTAWHLERSLGLRIALFDMHKPVVAQVHGRCLAGGTDIALMCDMIICSDDAQFGYPPVRSMGSPPSHMWLYHLGPQWAKRLLLTGDSILGSDAARIGLVLKSVPLHQLAAEAEALADRLALIDTDLLAANKRIVNQGLELMGARTLQRLAAEMDARGHLAKSDQQFSEDVRQQGLKAALRKRDEPFGDGLVRP